MWGEGRAKACTTNSAHERLMQQEQLSSIVSLQISSVPHFASQCVSSKRAREETNQKKTAETSTEKEKAKYQDARWSSVFTIQNCSGCVVGP